MQYKPGWHRSTGILIFTFLLSKVSTWLHVTKQRWWFTLLEHVNASGQAWAEQEWPPKDGINRKNRNAEFKSADLLVQIQFHWSKAESFVVLVGNVPGFLLEGRVCSCSGKGSKRGDRIVIAMRQHYLLSRWSSGKRWNPWSQEKVSAVQIREKLPQPIMTVWVLHWQKLLCTLGHPRVKRVSTGGCQEG